MLFSVIRVNLFSLYNLYNLFNIHKLIYIIKTDIEK